MKKSLENMWGIVGNFVSLPRKSKENKKHAHEVYG